MVCYVWKQFQMFKRTGIAVLCIGGILTAVLLLIISAPVFVKKKLIHAVNTRSEYNLQIDQLALGMAAVQLNGITLQPRLGKKAYFKKLGKQADWISVKIGLLELNGINWKRLLLHDELELKNIVVNDADVYVYRDKRLPHAGTYKPLPSTLLRQSDFRFIVPVCNISGSRVVYEETGPGNKLLKVPFSRLEAKLLHFASDEIYMREHTQVSIKASAYIFDTAETHIAYSADVFDSLDTYLLKGTVNSFPATMLNQTEPATGVGIESGQIHGIRFSFRAHEHASFGTMNIRYENLRVKVSEDVKRNKLKTMVANLAIRDENPGRNGKHTGEIHFNRNKDRFIFNYWWHSFKSGVFSAIIKTADR